MSEHSRQSVTASNLAGDLFVARPSAAHGGRLLVRGFVAQWDYPVFAEWLRAHGREEVPAWALPFVGFVVQAVPASNFAGLSLEPRPLAVGDNDESGNDALAKMARPLAVAFGYQDGRVGAVTWLTVAPGLGPKTALTACSLVTAAVERELEARGVRLMISPTERPSLVKFMRRRGWRVAHAANVLLYKTVDRTVSAATVSTDSFCAGALSARSSAVGDGQKGGEVL